MCVCVCVCVCAQDPNVSGALTVGEDRCSLYCPKADLSGIVAFAFDRVLRKSESNTHTLAHCAAIPLVHHTLRQVTQAVCVRACACLCVPVRACACLCVPVRVYGWVGEWLWACMYVH